VGGALTVSVPVFDNRTFRRGVETDLTRWIAAEIQARSRLRIVETAADLVVEGSIVEIAEIPLSEKEGQQIRESSVLVTVEFTVRDGRTGDPVVRRRKVTERESFVPEIGESLRTARAEALKRIASGVADALEK
jgi:hypothetical protein